jgi:transposase
LREQKDSALPKSQYGQAIGYVLNHWDELRRFTEDGHLGTDNNTAERTLRLCATSRKNWLFVGRDRGGKTAVNCSSIPAGVKRHRIELFAYVRALPIALFLNEASPESLLPDVWITAHPEHFLTYRGDEAETAVIARRRRRERRRREAPEHSRSPRDGRGTGWGLYGPRLRNRRTAHRDRAGNH